MPNPFIDRQDLTDYLGRDVTTDAGALIAVDAACEAVRTISEQDFNAATSTETFDGSGTDALLLHQLPVNSVGTVSVYSGGTWTTAGTADYSLNGNGVLLATNTAGTSLLGTTWPAGRQNVQVTYNHGYADSDLPRDVRRVALEYAARMIVQGVAKSEVSGTQQVTYGINSTDFTNGELMILRKYKQSR